MRLNRPPPWRARPLASAAVVLATSTPFLQAVAAAESLLAAKFRRATKSRTTSEAASRAASSAVPVLTCGEFKQKMDDITDVSLDRSLNQQLAMIYTSRCGNAGGIYDEYDPKTPFFPTASLDTITENAAAEKAQILGIQKELRDRAAEASGHVAKDMAHLKALRAWVEKKMKPLAKEAAAEGVKDVIDKIMGGTRLTLQKARKLAKEGPNSPAAKQAARIRAAAAAATPYADAVFRNSVAASESAKQNQIYGSVCMSLTQAGYNLSHSSLVPAQNTRMAAQALFQAYAAHMDLNMAMRYCRLSQTAQQAATRALESIPNYVDVGNMAAAYGASKAR